MNGGLSGLSICLSATSKKACDFNDLSSDLGRLSVLSVTDKRQRSEKANETVACPLSFLSPLQGVGSPTSRRPAVCAG
jgi:hypothetical protein